MKKILFILLLTLFFESPAFAARTPKDFQDAIRLGDEAIFYKEYDRAERYFRWALSKEPAKYLPHLKLGLLYYEAGQYSRALLEFQTALGRRPGLSESEFLSFAFERISSRKQLFEEIENLHEQQAVSPRLAELHLEAGRWMSEKKFYAALAGPHFEFLLEIAPKNRELLEFLAKAYYESSLPRKAGPLYKKLCALGGATRALYERTAECFVAERGWSDVQFFYHKALREAVRNHENTQKLKKQIQSLPVQAIRISRWIDELEYDKAVRALKKYLALNPSDAWAITLLGLIHLQKNEVNAADSFFKKAVEIAPDYPAAHFYQGSVALKKSRYEEAMAELQRYRSLARDAFKRLEKPNEEKEAAEQWADATRMIASTYLEYFNDAPHAVQELEALKKIRPKDAKVYYDLGVAYLKSKKKASAYQQFQKVIQLDGRSELAKAAEDAIEYLRTHSDNMNEYASPYN